MKPATTSPATNIPPLRERSSGHLQRMAGQVRRHNEPGLLPRLPERCGWVTHLGRIGTSHAQKAGNAAVAAHGSQAPLGPQDLRAAHTGTFSRCMTASPIGSVRSASEVHRRAGRQAMQHLVIGYLSDVLIPAGGWPWGWRPGEAEQIRERAVGASAAGCGEWGRWSHLDAGL